MGNRLWHAQEVHNAVTHVLELHRVAKRKTSCHAFVDVTIHRETFGALMVKDESGGWQIDRLYIPERQIPNEDEGIKVEVLGVWERGGVV